MKMKPLLGVVMILALCGGVSQGGGGGGIYTADVEMSLADWYSGESFMATINPDSHVPEDRKSFAGSFSGPAWDPLSVVLSGMPVYLIGDSGVDELDGPASLEDLPDPVYPENAAWGQSLYETWVEGDPLELRTDFGIRHFSWTKVGELSLYGTPAGGGTFDVVGSFSEVFGGNYFVSGSIDLYFPGPDWSAGPDGWLWVGVGNVNVSGEGVSLQSGDPRWWDNPVVVRGGEEPDEWVVEGTNGWPGATLDKFFFSGGSFDVNLWTPSGSADGTRVVDGFASGGFGTQGLAGTPLADTIEVENVVLEDGMWTLAVGYDPAEVDVLGLDEESLRLYWWDEEAEQWLAAGNPSNLVDNGGDPGYAGFVLGEPTDVLGDWGVDLAHRVVWANLDHGSTFSVAGVPEPATATLWLTGCVALGLWFGRQRYVAH